MESLRHLFIPTRLKAGYNNRTFRDSSWEVNKEKAESPVKLAYVIYWDEKGKLRKETSWENWRDKNLGEEKLGNEPTHGYSVYLARNGYRGDWWSGRDSKILIRHPHGFLFEITPENLCSLIIESGVESNTGIIGGEQVLAWDGKELVLLGTASTEYKASMEHTDKVKSAKIKTSDLIPGHIYLLRDGTKRLYFGKLEYWKTEYAPCPPVDKEGIENSGWRLTNPFNRRDESDFYSACKWYKVFNIGSSHSYVEWLGRDNCKYSDYMMSFKTCNTIVDDLGEYPEWKDVLHSVLNKKHYLYESLLNPITEYRPVALSRDEFIECLGKASKEIYVNGLYMYSMKYMQRVYSCDFDDVKLLLQDDAKIDKIMEKYMPAKIQTILKDGTVVQENWCFGYGEINIS